VNSRAIAVIVSSFMLGSCGIVTWKTAYTSTSGDGSAKVEVAQVCGLSDCMLRVVASNGWRSQPVALRRGCILKFAHAAWSGKRVATFVDGSFCGAITVAYDFGTNREIAFETLSQDLKAAIIADYSVGVDELQASGGDIFRWASYPADGVEHRAMAEFRRRYPQALP
jgi:hypothetical protein